jgi:pteridine reductase
VRLGAGIARALARDGADLLLHYHRSEEPAQRLAAELSRGGRRVELFRADLAEAGSAGALVEAAARAFGRLDIAVSNAGVFSRRRLEELSDEEWSRTLELNLSAPFRLARAAAPLLRESRGCLINVACVSAVQPWRHFAHYATSKAALVMLTRCLALELAPEVRVNAVAPGTALPPEEYDEARREALRRNTPLGRFGGEAAVAEAVRYLAGADFVTGVLLPVDGGRSLVGETGHD